jgi:hypothetical protein
MMRIKAKNKPGTPEYYHEPYTVQHFTDWLGQAVIAVPSFCWFALRHFTSRSFRMDTARQYNRALFGNVPTEQIYKIENDNVRQLRPTERTWPE